MDAPKPRATIVLQRMGRIQLRLSQRILGYYELVLLSCFVTK